MRKPVSLLIVVSFLLISAVMPAERALSQSVAAQSSKSSSQSLIWRNYDEALSLAKKEGKHIMVFFTTSWCVYCKKMKKDTFTDPDVMKIMKDRFVLATVDGDSKSIVHFGGKEVTEKELAQLYGVRGYPTMVFLKPAGDGIAPISGYRDAKFMVTLLDYVGSSSYDKMTLQEFAQQRKN